MKKLRNSILVSLLLLISCQQKQKNESRVDRLPYYKDAYFTPHWNLSKQDLKTFHKISDFSLVAQNGETITQKNFENKIYVVDFFFTTCPGICPRMANNMALVQKEFLEDKEVLLLSHSVTPTKDSIAVLKQYAQKKGVVSNKWFLATGDKKQIYSLGRNSYFVEEDQGVDATFDEFLHSENFVLIDKNKHIRGIYNGLNKTAIHQLIVDIKMLKGEI